jgi:hypothetical protein
MKRAMIPEWRTPDEAQDDAERLRKRLLNPDLSENEADDIASLLAQSVSVYSDPQQRRIELADGRPYSTEAESHAALVEYNALHDIVIDKAITAQYANNLSGAALAISSMNNNKFIGRPVDLSEMKSQIQSQIADLRASGASREDHLALLAILAQQAGQAIAGIANRAHSPEAEAIMLKQSVNAFESSGRLVEKLHKLDQMPSHLIVKGDGHNIAHNQQILQNADQPNQLLENKNADRSNTSIMDTSEAASNEPVDAQKQAVDKKHRAKK